MAANRFKTEHDALDAIRAAGLTVTRRGELWHVTDKRIDIATVDLLTIRRTDLTAESVPVPRGLTNPVRVDDERWR